MKKKRAPTTVYLDERLARAAKMKALLTGESLSDLVNDSLARLMSEDEADLALMRKRKGNPSRDYEEFLAELKRDALI